MSFSRQAWRPRSPLWALAGVLGCTDTLLEDGPRPTPTPIPTVVGAPPPPVFVGDWGGYGTEPGQFVEPSSVELDVNGVVIVAGHEDRVQRFTPDGEFIDLFGVPGSGDGEFDHPHGLAVNRALDRLYVGDQENGRLQVFTTAGVFVNQWGDDGFQHIHDVGIDPASGNLYIGDYELDTLRVFEPDGTLVASHGGTGSGPGQFEGVWGVSTDSEGYVYAADTFNQRVQKLDRSGVFVAEWTDIGGATMQKPTGVYVDSRDRVYVCDSLAQRVGVFDTAGELLEFWDLAEIVGRASEPEDVVVNETTGHIYIGEVLEHTVLHLAPSTP